MVRLHTELTLASFPVHLKDSQRKNNWIEMISLQLLTLYFEGSSFQGDQLLVWKHWIQKVLQL